MAANVIIAFISETKSTDDDFDKQTESLISNSEALKIDKNKIGI